MNRSVGTVLQLAAALLLTAALLVAVELGSGVVLRAHPSPAGLRADAVAVALRTLRTNPVPLVFDADLLWRNRPSTAGTRAVDPRHPGGDETWSFRIDSEGFRGPERELRGQDGVYRILCVGDSVTFGFNVNEDDVWPRRVEQALRDAYPGRRFEVVNAGVVGWTWVQGARYLEREGFALRPDLVLIAHGTNDQFWNATMSDSEHLLLLRNPLVRWGEHLGWLLSTTNTYRVLRATVDEPDREQPNSPDCEAQLQKTRACHRVSVDEIERTVAAIGRAAKPQAVDVVVLNLDFLETPAAGGARDGARRAGIPFVDVTADFAATWIAEGNARARELGLQPQRIPRLVEQRFDEATQSPRGSRFLFRVFAGASAQVVSVSGDVPLPTGYDFEEAMYDDATHGDEVAGDGVFSLRLEVPRGVGSLEYLYHRDGVPEFEAVPPNTTGAIQRTVQFGDDSIGFIDTFGERSLMSESVHPDARGHALIARRVLKELPQVDSFPKFVAGPGGP